MHPKKSLLYVGNQLLSHGLSPTNADILPPLLRAEGYAVTVVSDKWIQLQRLIDMLVTTLKHRRKADLVFIDTYSTRNFYYAVAVAAVCRFYKIPYVPILRGGNLPARLETHPRMSQKLFGNAYINMAPSKYLYSGFKAKNFQNLVYIPNTIPLANYTFKKRHSLEYRLLWVRSFADIYNPTMALEVMELLQMKGNSVSLCMVGPDKDGSMERCKALAKEKGLDVIFTGMLSKSDWLKLSEGFDIFINTTNFDNTPVSVIEAMALGMPVVSTNVGGIPFLIEDGKTGILTEPDDAAAMASAIMALVNNPEKALELTENARAMVELFDWEVVKEQWRELVEGVGVRR